MLHNSFDMSSTGTSIQIGDFGTRRWAKKLPREVWQFIDACLPLADLFLHKQVSKAWRTRIAKNRAVKVAERVRAIIRPRTCHPEAGNLPVVSTAYSFAAQF